MRGRSLAAALALAFGATTLAVFVLVGSFLYLALEKQIKEQDNLDIVLAARHARRLAEELDSVQGIRQHRDRLTSIVLGNEAMSMEVFDPDGTRAIEHNIAGALAVPDAASGAATIAALPPLTRVAATSRITEADLGDWTGRDGAPIRGIRRTRGCVTATRRACWWRAT